MPLDKTPIHQTPCRSHLVAIDARLPGASQFLAGDPAQDSIMVVDSEEDCILKITCFLEAHGSVTDIHLVGRGKGRQLLLGATVLQLHSLWHYETQLQQWWPEPPALYPPRLGLYGSPMAIGETGALFLRLLQAMTGASVYASLQAPRHQAIQPRSNSFKESSPRDHWGLEVCVTQEGGMAIASAPQLYPPFPATALDSLLQATPTLETIPGQTLESASELTSEPTSDSTAA